MVGRKKIHWGKWNRVYLALEKGGLGCKYILAMNVKGEMVMEA